MHSGTVRGLNERPEGSIKAGPRLRECCRQGQAQVVSNGRNKIHQTWEKQFSQRFVYIAQKSVVEASCPLHYSRTIWWEVSRPRKRKNSCLFSIYEPAVNIVTDVWSETIQSLDCFRHGLMRHLPKFGPTNIRPAERSHLSKLLVWHLHSFLVRVYGGCTNPFVPNRYPQAMVVWPTTSLESTRMFSIKHDCSKFSWLSLKTTAWYWKDLYFHVGYEKVTCYNNDRRANCYKFNLKIFS